MLIFKFRICHPYGFTDPLCELVNSFAFMKSTFDVRMYAILCKFVSCTENAKFFNVWCIIILKNACWYSKSGQACAHMSWEEHDTIKELIRL